MYTIYIHDDSDWARVIYFGSSISLYVSSLISLYGVTCIKNSLWDLFYYIYSIKIRKYFDKLSFWLSKFVFFDKFGIEKIQYSISLLLKSCILCLISIILVALLSTENCSEHGDATAPEQFKKVLKQTQRCPKISSNEVVIQFIVNFSHTHVLSLKLCACMQVT